MFEFQMFNSMTHYVVKCCCEAANITGVTKKLTFRIIFSFYKAPRFKKKIGIK